MASNKDYTDQEEQDFIEGLYNKANDDLKPLYEATDSNLKDFLKEIASILLTYNIVKDVMTMSKGEQAKEYIKMSKIIKRIVKNQATQQEILANSILKDTVKGTFYFYNFNPDRKVAQELINENYKGKHFSERVWDNDKAVGEHLHYQTNEFLKGNTSVNAIKKDIEATFDTSKYNAKRLVETEVSRCSNSTFDRFCIETGVKKVKYNAALESCEKCKPFDGKPYDFDKKPYLPKHPLCRCFYETVDENKTNQSESNKKQPSVMDLQLFSNTKDKNNVIRLIDQGLLDENKFKKFYSDFNNMFQKGIDTPLGKVENSNNRAYHIAFKHKDLMNDIGLKRIEETLKNPDIIRKAIDINGSENNGYIKEFDNKVLLVITSGDIITSYYPNKNYIKNKIEGWEVIWDKK